LKKEFTNEEIEKLYFVVPEIGKKKSERYEMHDFKKIIFKDNGSVDIHFTNTEYVLNLQKSRIEQQSR